MITGAVFNAFLSALDAIFSLLPSFSISAPTNDWFLNAAALMNGIFPIQTCVDILLAMLITIAALRTWDFGVFVYHQFWGSD